MSYYSGGGQLHNLEEPTGTLITTLHQHLITLTPAPTPSDGFLISTTVVTSTTPARLL
ncbi:hypothetical protein [Spirosoma oryzae]|uniref:hypothetical protein n=1 Tax=Spirosoma oryzae TaxID=1469603 RepID=UPI001473760C|nr:hypothetical protein [Spirosoma oryzae]